MKSLFCPVFLCLLCADMLSAQGYRISGSVENAQNEPVAYANVQLLEAADSTLVSGASSDEGGRFVIEGIAQGSYFVKASYIENESEPRPIEVHADIVLEPLRLGEEAQALDEVVVTSQEPRLERKVDRLIFNIENTAVADGNIWDVLKRTPSVTIVNDQLTVKGSGAIGILINGRKVNLPKGDIINLLSGTSASDVEAIEVITTPP
ncbi:MAG TPA: carboxypeptidase regulatory-like domain-containing protein, partial [Pricia sp.]|nr:carboxypeptidase regulatory-like domain-containing protein [Pricia sp.]